MEEVAGDNQISWGGRTHTQRLQKAWGLMAFKRKWEFADGIEFTLKD